MGPCAVVSMCQSFHSLCTARLTLRVECAHGALRCLQPLAAGRQVHVGLPCELYWVITLLCWVRYFRVVLGERFRCCVGCSPHYHTSLLRDVLERGVMVRHAWLIRH